MSCSVAKHALPITRFSIIRPATATRFGVASSVALSLPSCTACSSPARASRRKSFGYALADARNAASLARRSAMTWLSSWTGCSLTSHSLLQAGRDEIVEVPVEHRLRIAHFVAGAQVLDSRLVEHVRADLVTPADVRLRVLELRLLFLALAQLELVELRLQHCERLGAVAVLRPVRLALDDDVGGQVRDAHGGVGLVDVLSAGARCAIGVDAQVGRIDVELDRFVHLGIDEHAREGRMPSRVRVERTLAHEPVHAGLRAEEPVRVFAVGLDRRALDARHFTGRFLEHLDGKALALTVAQI